MNIGGEWCYFYGESRQGKYNGVCTTVEERKIIRWMWVMVVS